MIRLADPNDAQGMLAIYGPYVRDTSYTFETVEPSPKDFADRISAYLTDWPWLVCEIDGRIAGYAYVSRYRERTAYQWSAECSVYIHDDFLRRGIGRSLYEALFDILQRQGYRNVYAVINLPNEKSVAFHESMQFSHFATYEQVGYKLGRWKNVGWWRRILNEFSLEPRAVVPFSRLDRSFLPELLKKATRQLR
jgi:phosphinothricin acetyltransferase